MSALVEAEKNGEARVKAAVATVHYPIPAKNYQEIGDLCAWCKHPWPCKTAQAVNLNEIITDRERIIRAITDVTDGAPHKHLLRPFAEQIICLVRRGGAPK